jgi:hypothetical protein
MKPNQPFFLDPSEETRFWSYVAIEELDDCWEWRKGFDYLGYGLFYSGPERHRSHRISWTVCFGLIPENLNVLHRCDNRKCVNPGRLFLGTHSENMADMAKKDRGTSGERSWTVRLTTQQVLEIRARHASGELGYRKLAQLYGVGRSTIRYIIIRKSWNHL